MARLILATALLASACGGVRAADDPLPYRAEVHGLSRGVGTLSTPAPQPTAPPPPTATPAVSGGIDAWLAASPWPEFLWPAVKAVGMCESGLRPGVDSPGGANRGLMQINRVHIGGKIAARGYTWADMLDPVRNLEVAWDIYNDSGWQPWSCAP